MNGTEPLAPAVRSILESARDRGSDGARRGGAGRVSVDPRSLPAAIERARADDRVPIIAEVKPTSPTTDGEHGGDPVEVATAMVEAGAAVVSVLTEPEHFGGSPGDLRRVRGAVDVPVLRKDFLLREAHLDAVAADVALLIARFVDDLPGMVAAARERGFQVLVEVHTREEAAAALEAGADLVGVNNRDLARLEVDLGTFEAVAPAVPDDVLLVAESGIRTPAHVRRMRRAGADALLVGSALMVGDPRETTAELVGATGGADRGDSPESGDADRTTTGSEAGDR